MSEEAPLSPELSQGRNTSPVGDEMKPPARPEKLTPHWARALGHQFWVLWVLKMLGTIAGISVFFTVYFWVLNNPTTPVAVMRSTSLDAWIGFHPWSLPLYLSLWFYVGLLPAFQENLRELIRYLGGVLLLSAVGLGIFYFWPTAVPPMPPERVEHSWFGFLNEVDASGNACPSMHAAFAVFTAVGFRRVLCGVGASRWIHSVNWLWSVAICYSTVATRQHVVLDAVAGAALGGAIGWLIFSARRTLGSSSCAAVGTTQR